jgi:hypothetical protein
MEKQLLKQIRSMKIYLAVSTLVFLSVIIYLVKYNDHPRFSELDVERINVMEKDGTVKLVISNDARQSPGRINGKELPARQRSAGMIFFNSDGDECGGLIYDGNKKGAGMVLSIDQYLQDQIMQLQYSQENGKKHYGFKVYDRPDNNMGDLIAKVDSLKKLDKASYEKGLSELKDSGQLGMDRLFVGRMDDGSVGLFIKDAKGIPKVKLYVDKNGKAKIEITDEKHQ